MARLRRLATLALDGLVVALFLFFVGLLAEPHLWDGPLVAWLVVLGLTLSFGVAIAAGIIRRRRSPDGPRP